jgi:hypothetical protein
VRDWSKLSNARKTMKPSRIANPVESIPKVPAARSPSLKKPPSGARRRTYRSSPTAAAAAMTQKMSVQTTLIAG